MHKLLICTAWLISFNAMAHDGHGLEGPHTHATDALGFVVAVLVVAAMIWTGRK
jgi:hypothetical protein